MDYAAIGKLKAWTFILGIWASSKPTMPELATRVLQVRLSWLRLDTWRLVHSILPLYFSLMDTVGPNCPIYIQADGLRVRTI